MAEPERRLDDALALVFFVLLSRYFKSSHNHTAHCFEFIARSRTSWSSQHLRVNFKPWAGSGPENLNQTIKSISGCRTLLDMCAAVRLNKHVVRSSPLSVYVCLWSSASHSLPQSYIYIYDVITFIIINSLSMRLMLTMRGRQMCVWVFRL